MEFWKKLGRKLGSKKRIDEIFINPKAMGVWTDRVGYGHILLIWVLIVVCFGLLYFFFQDSNSFLYDTSNGKMVNELDESIYFSFVAATTTGFGDIAPKGVFRLVVILELIFGLMLLAVVTSKFVSVKQDVMLNELYEYSLNERINRLGSSLLLFRQNLDRLMNKVEDGSIRRREMNDLTTYLSSFGNVLREISILISRPKDEFIKNIDAVNTELIFNNIITSLEKFYEIVTLLNVNKMAWRTETSINYVNKNIEMIENLFNKLNNVELQKQTVNDLNLRKGQLVNRIKEELNKKDDFEKVSVKDLK